ncbi:MAG: thiol peroxidase [Acidobacteria bacterium]|nr:thiol peroxidase [Acidobacteriota bacterium]
MTQNSDRTVTMKGNPLPLAGQAVQPGDLAPAFTVVDNDLKPVQLENYTGKIKIIAAVPSLDTPVCDTEIRTFNQRAGELGDDVVILTVSMDLPFAQKRWCGAAGIRNVVTLSDYQQASFGEAFGVLIPGLRLLARAVFVVDKDDVIRYTEIVPEVTAEPDYDRVLAEAKRIAAGS